MFAGSYGERRVLYRRDLDRVDPEPIVGPRAEAMSSFPTIAGESASRTRSELWTASLDGGTPQTAAPQPSAARRNLGTGRPNRRRSCGLGPVDGFRDRRRASSAHGSRARGSDTKCPRCSGGRAVLFTILAHATNRRTAAVYLLETGETRRFSKAWALASSAPAMSCLAGRRALGSRLRSRTRCRRAESPDRYVTTSCGRQRAIRSSR